MSDQFTAQPRRTGSAAEAKGDPSPMPGAASLRPIRTQSRDSAVLDRLAEFITAAGYEAGAQL